MFNFIPENRKFEDELNTLAWGTDAGFYRLIPDTVILAKDENEVSEILKEAHRNGISVTFRAAGTSLSGQAITDSVLLVANKNWEKWSISEDCEHITMQPGLVGGQVNRILSRYGRRFGPDPASIGSSMIGGIVMNNASGMSCGIHANSDRMIESARLVLADGTMLDTGDEASRIEFSKSHPELIAGIEALRDRVNENVSLRERIRKKYSIKNVTGLNLLPLIMYSDPFEIMTHLIVGSEGTLAFMSEVTMKTLPALTFKASAMAYFRNISDAAKAVVGIKQLSVNAAELLDKRSLASVGITTVPGSDVPLEDITAVLIEVAANTEKELHQRSSAVADALGTAVTPVEFTSDPEICGKYWAIRSGIFPTVGGMREAGTTCMIEDVAFHIEDLPEATADLSALLDRHGYYDSCIYGHALEGNFHFIINQKFETQSDVDRYDAMIRDVAKMVVEKYDGSLKAEHGTGRNMAPFVEYEWGSDAMEAMREIKRLFDPHGILNPGVIFNDDPKCYLKNFKHLPILEPDEGAPLETVEAYRKINKCIECGFCEVNCLSCGFTMSSRTRIVAQRELARLHSLPNADSSRIAALERQYSYLGEKTCAGDGLCSTSCPMGISVADLTHEIRRQNIGSAARTGWKFAADHFHGTKNVLRVALAAADAGNAILGSSAMGTICKGLHKTGIPLWTPSFPKPCSSPETPTLCGHKDKVVYFPSCLNQMMGPQRKSPVSRPLADETVELLHKAGYDVIFPKNMDSLCCGTLWESKGMPDIAEKKVRELDKALWTASEYGKWPVLCDQSPCLHRMRLHIDRMKLYEPAEFIWLFLRDKLNWNRMDDPVVIHQTCTMRLMGLADTLYKVASLCSSNVLIPEGVGCCGFAGDKGMTNPELNAWALRKLRGQVSYAGIKVGYSNSRTCEIGLTTNSGIPYVSIVYLVNSCTSSLNK